MRNRKIRFNEPLYNDNETNNLKQFLHTGKSFKEKVKRHLLKTMQADKIFLTSGASSAMELFFTAEKFKKDGEVIMPSFTFPSAANVVLNAGLKPVFTDIDLNTLVMNIDEAGNKITKKTVCIMPMHYGGASVDMDVLLSIAENKNISVFEDGALSYGGEYKGRHLGTIGDAGTISFGRTKNISGEGGGALILNRKEKYSIYEEILAWGTDKQAFLRGEVKEYTWRRKGISGEMSEMEAAVLSAQLEKEDEIRKKRKAAWYFYMRNLKELSEKKGIKLPVIPKYNTNNYHVFYVVFESNKIRENARRFMMAENIEAFIHYMPLHSSHMGMAVYTLSVTETLSKRLLRLPMHALLEESDCERVVKAIEEALL